MEQDALQQAKQLQAALGDILGHVKTLQAGCQQVAQTASQLKEAASQSVVTNAVASTTLKTTADVSTTERMTEETLATRLSEAFAARDAAHNRVEGVRRFLEKFDLSEEDSELLETYNFEDLTDLNAPDADTTKGLAFLGALENVRRIRQSLQLTFGSSEEESSAGLGANSALRIMESVSEKQERGYERLYNFLQKHVDSSSPFVQQAITALRHVPAFYSHMMELVASARRAVVTRHFLLALTQGVDGGTPLELKAHDSVTCKWRFLLFIAQSYNYFHVADVGDMLAHIFKAFSVEADLAQSLLNPENDDGEETSDADPSLGEDADDPLFTSQSAVTASSILGIAVSGLCRPLKSRLLQVISNLSSHDVDNDYDDDDEDDFVEDEGTASRNRLAQLYEICGLMLFYVSTLEKGLNKIETSDGGAQSSNPLITCLEECVKEGVAAYEASIRVYGAMLNQTSMTTGDSQAKIVHQLIVQFSKIQSPATVDHVLSIEWVTETLIQSTQCTSLDDTVTLSQAVSLAQTIGMSEEAFNKLIQEIQSKEQLLVDQMVESESVQVLELCGMASLVDSFQRWKSSGASTPMAQFPGLSAEDVSNAVKEFYESLYSPPIPSLEGVVTDPSARKRVRAAICLQVCDLYEQLHATMTSNQGGYGDLSFLAHSPKQVGSLFTV